MSRRKTKQLQKIVKKANPFILLLFALIFVGAGIGGYFFSQSKIANDKFEIVGDKTITMVLGDQSYQDEGAVAISFGRNISYKIVAEENIDYSADEEESLFTDIKKAKVAKKGKNEIQEMDIDEPTSKTVFKKVKKIAKMRKASTEEDF